MNTHSHLQTESIPDGYSRMARVAGSGFHPAVWLEYRPMLVRDYRRLCRRLRAVFDTADEWEAPAQRLAAAELARRIVSWNLADARGVPVEIDAESVALLEPHLVARLFEIVAGSVDLRRRARAEAADMANLKEGVRLLLMAPQVATRDCRDCQKFVYDEATGRRQLHAGRPVPRPAGTLAPCRLPHVGCPKGTPEQPRTLSAANHEAYRYDRECRAAGQFPDDPIVRRHAVVIRDAHAAAKCELDGAR